MNWRTLIAHFLRTHCALALAFSTAAARPWIDMGLKDDAAYSQPIVEFELFELIGAD